MVADEILVSGKRKHWRRHQMKVWIIKVMDIWECQGQ